jgi:DnaK suppressor protein
MMTDQVVYFDAVLRNKRSELALAIRTQGAQLSVCEGGPDVLDRMQSMSRRDEAVAFIDMLTRTLAAVDAALLAIKEDSYGTCGECGEPISSRRLEAIPWALHCIRCQEVLDHHRYARVAVAHWDEAA